MLALVLGFAATVISIGTSVPGSEQTGSPLPGVAVQATATDQPPQAEPSARKPAAPLPNASADPSADSPTQSSVSPPPAAQADHPISEETEPATEPTPAWPLGDVLNPNAKKATGDWGGLRTKLNDVGLRFHLFYNNQYFAVLKGGVHHGGAGKNSASADMLISLDLGRAGILENADMLIHVQVTPSAGINPDAGALQQVVDDADGRDNGYVDQLWIRKHFFEHRVSLQLGFLDYQTILDRNAHANSEDIQFVNQSLDNNPLIPLNIGLGISVTVRPAEWYTLIAGVGDAHSVLYKPGFSTAFHDNPRFVAYVENDFHIAPKSRRGPMPGNYRFGVIYDPRGRPVFVRPRDRARRWGDDYGFYISFDQMLFRESAEDEQGLGIFLRAAHRRAETHKVSDFWSAGLSYKGLIPGRDRDVVGWAFSLQDTSKWYRSRVRDQATRETVYELYYAVQVTDWMTMTPDIQYVDNPGAEGRSREVIVAGIRWRITL